VTEATLPNGLRVVVVEHHRRPIVLVHLLLPRGALLDAPGREGATWLGVQIASDHREVEYADGVEIEERSFRRQVIDRGGFLEVDVGPDHSLLSLSGYARSTGSYLKLIADGVTRPRRGKTSFRERRNALLDEQEDVETSDPEALWRAIAEASFGRGHPYARSVVGTAGSLKRLELAEAVARQAEVLVPDGATLLVVGDVSAPVVVEGARAAFGRWKGSARRPPAVVPPAAPPPAEVGFLQRKPAATLLACATRPLGEVKASDAALDLLADTLGHGLRGRLVEALRERAGLTYGASVAVVRRRGARALLACSALQASQGDAGLRLFRETLDAVVAAPPTDDEVERARALGLGRLDSAWDGANAVADTWLRALTLGRSRPDLVADRAELEALRPGELRELSRTVLHAGAIRWVLSGEPEVARRAVEATRLGELRALRLDH
jgi:zinc protease